MLNEKTVEDLCPRNINWSRFIVIEISIIKEILIYCLDANLSVLNLKLPELLFNFGNITYIIEILLTTWIYISYVIIKI